MPPVAVVQECSSSDDHCAATAALSMIWITSAGSGR
jgi:hypothetical protein